VVPLNHPLRCCKKVEDWPEIDRALWEASMNDSDPLEEPGLTSHWAPATRHKNRRGYGRWLNFLETSGQLDPMEDPANRLACERIGTYISELKDQGISSYTLRNRILELLAVISAFRPDLDWTWLRRVGIRLNSAARPRISKFSRLVSSDVILFKGIEHMEWAAARPGAPRRNWLSNFRDGLMISLLSTRPLRLSNFASIIIGKHLIKHEEGFNLSFEAHETKTQTPIAFSVPDILVPWMNQYLSEVRPLLLAETLSDQLWISYQGVAMNDKGIYRRVIATTEELFGHAINPHSFRHAAATTWAIEDPEHVMASARLLGHRTSTTTMRNYNHAQMIESSRSYGEIIMELRREGRHLRPFKQGD
jgi:integrase/recombinase XerD